MHDLNQVIYRSCHFLIRKTVGRIMTVYRAVGGLSVIVYWSIQFSVRHRGPILYDSTEKPSFPRKVVVRTARKEGVFWVCIMQQPAAGAMTLRHLLWTLNTPQKSSWRGRRQGGWRGKPDIEVNRICSLGYFCQPNHSGCVIGIYFWSISFYRCRFFLKAAFPHPVTDCWTDL